MPLKPETISKLDANLDSIIADLAVFQDAYISSHKGYWQGIYTPRTPLKEGLDKEIELNLKPTDQAEDWTGILKSTLQPCAIEVHVHDGPLSKGYTIYISTIAEDGSLWIKAFGVKAHSDTFDWREVVDGPNR